MRASLTKLWGVVLSVNGVIWDLADMLAIVVALLVLLLPFATIMGELYELYRKETTYAYFFIGFLCFLLEPWCHHNVECSTCAYRKQRGCGRYFHNPPSTTRKRRRSNSNCCNEGQNIL